MAGRTIATTTPDPVDLGNDELDKVGAGSTLKSTQDPARPRSAGLAGGDLADWQANYGAGG